MNALVPALLTAMLSLLALIHVYWAVSGAGAGSGFIPDVNGKPLFSPSPLATLAVAAALSAAAFVAGSRGGLFLPSPPGSFAHWAAIGLGLLFLLRAVGELRYVGFFKRHRGTRFARLDTWLFSPLCVLIGAGFLFVATLP